LLLLYLTAQGWAIAILRAGDAWLLARLGACRNSGRGGALPITVNEPDVATRQGAEDGKLNCQCRLAHATFGIPYRQNHKEIAFDVFSDVF